MSDYDTPEKVKTRDAELKAACKHDWEFTGYSYNDVGANEHSNFECNECGDEKSESTQVYTGTTSQTITLPVFPMPDTKYVIKTSQPIQIDPAFSMVTIEITVERLPKEGDENGMDSTPV